MKRVFFVLILALFISCSSQKEFVLTGPTMGTAYHIKIIGSPFLSVKNIEKQIKLRLQAINNSMSTFISQSEISRFNDIKDKEKKFYISDDFMDVIKQSEKIYKITSGAWDGTVKPLVSLWGFGKISLNREMPSSQEIENTLSNIGFNNIQIGDHFLIKKKANIFLDLASIAKGYGVDQIAQLLKEQNISNYLVEIGGEVYASGLGIKKNKWKIGINKPDKNAETDEIYSVIELHNKAIATSGDYRNFFEKNGKTYSHIIDPNTGYPVSNNVVSASVIANSCTFADGLATALMVMGQEKGIKLVNTIDNVEALIVVHENNELKNYFSKGFKNYLKSEK